MKITKILFVLLVLGSLLVACMPSAAAVVNTEYVLTTDMRDGKFVFLGVNESINGAVNPALHAKRGERITVILINSGEGEHDLVFPELNVKSDTIHQKGETTTVTFTVPDKDEVLNYQDSAHAKLGMNGVLLVGEVVTPAGAAEVPAVEKPAAASPDKEMASQAIQKGGCVACHTISGIPGAVGAIGPDLSAIGKMAKDHLSQSDYTGTAKTAEEYINESIQNPDVYVAPKCPTGPCAKGLMPSTISKTLSADEIKSIVTFLASLPETAAASAPAAGSGTDMSMPAMAATNPADASAVDITRDPTEIPAPIGNRGPQNVRVDLETVEVSGKLADGSTYAYWTFGGKVPGPFIRIRVGDTAEVHLKNAMRSTMTHSVDFHAVTGPGGGAVSTQTQPGAETMFSFKALNPGLFVYHCATPMVAQHISNGMYGLILVEPAGGLPKVDREFYIMQGEIYTTQPFGTAGALTGDTTKLLDERPEYFVFNGAALALAGEAHTLKAKTGETVRIFFGVGGPNFISSFHVIGEIFDQVFDQASLTSKPLTDVQTTLVPPGGATMVEFKVEVPGRYILVDHALSRLQRGLAGYLIVEGDPNLEVFNGPAIPGSGH